VLVALVVLLVGAYVALRIFPSGFAAIERARLESQAARLADEEIQRWQLAAGSLPEAIVWADSSSGSLIYNTNYDPADLTPNEANPNWQPDSAYRPRTIIGEVLPLGDVTDSVTGAIRVPLCRLRFGPIEHLYDAPGPGDYPLFIYTTEYERVDRADFLSDDKDWGRYHIDYDTAAISFDYADYPRQFRVEFTYLVAPGPGAREERRYEMWQTAQLIQVAAGENTKLAPQSLWPGTQAIDVSPTGAVRSGDVVTITTVANHGFAAGQKVRIAGVTSVGGTEFNGIFVITAVPTPTTFSYSQVGPDDSGGDGTASPLPAEFEGVVPVSERVHQAFILDSPGPPSGPGHFSLDGDIAAPDSYLLFHSSDAGRTVNVDYRVRDWQILLEERTPDDSLKIQLAISPLKTAAYVNRPRQPLRNRIIPGDDAMVIILDTEDGSRLADSDFTVGYETGRITLGGAAEAGKTYRIYYRAEQDWTIQPIKAAADYGIIVGDTAQPGYRFAVWREPASPRELEFGRSEVTKSVVANYYIYANPAAQTDPRLIVGEMHQVALSGDRAVVQLAHDPAWGDIRVRGASMRARVLWAGRGRTTAVGGASSPESWRQAVVETFLRRQ
jgi:type II secretory pathway pseudopilin PulG